MTISHHPAEPLLLAFAGGTLEAAVHAVVATHIAGCERCRGIAEGAEQIGGEVLEAAPVDAMSAGSLDRLEALLDQPECAAAAAAVPASDEIEAPGMPPYVRRLDAGKWRAIAPGLHIRRLTPPAPGEHRLFLLRARAGMTLLPHGHSGEELTCVLKGSFSHGGNRYAPGDFDRGDGQGDHAITIGDEGECLCLVALTGKLQLRGFAGRMLQPFLAI